MVKKQGNPDFLEYIIIKQHMSGCVPCGMVKLHTLTYTFTYILIFFVVGTLKIYCITGV